MIAKKRTYEPRIFDGRVMLPEEQEQIYMQLLMSKRMEFVTDSMREVILEGVAGAGAQTAAEGVAEVIPLRAARGGKSRIAAGRSTKRSHESGSQARYPTAGRRGADSSIWRGVPRCSVPAPRGYGT
jgi:hypothetical protein